MGASTTEEEHVGTAFLLVSLAGLSTGVGAAFVCIPSLAKYATPRFLAAGLAFSAGVMVYVSFVEIFQKSFISFQNAGYKDGVANALCTLCFMSGICIVLVSRRRRQQKVFRVLRAKCLTTKMGLFLSLFSQLVDKIVHSILDHMQDHDHDNVRQTNSNRSRDSAVVMNPCHGVCVSDLADIMKKLEAQGEELGLETGWSDSCDHLEDGRGEEVPEQAPTSLYTVKGSGSEKRAASSVVVDTPKRLKKKAEKADDGSAENKQRLVQTGLKTSCAIVLHNLPEGIATFVAALADPKVGTLLAIAIAIHNIRKYTCILL